MANGTNEGRETSDDLTIVLKIERALRPTYVPSFCVAQAKQNVDAQGLMVDRAVGECLLEFGDALVGDLGVKEDERMQIGQPLEMHQPCVGDLGVVEVERPQLG